MRNKKYPFRAVLIITLTHLLISSSLFAQSPEKMSYQAVIRNSSNALVTNHAVGLKISILQGSISGSAVYVELFNPNPITNANGLVTVEIGTGIPTTGSFSTIDWSAGTYFIKTETDPMGGTTYTITGTSQLLSVAYALYAKTAETVKTITETDPVYAASQAKNITVTDISNLGNLSGTNTGDQDLSSLATKNALRDSTTKVRSEMPTTKHYIGESYGGGIVFWVDSNGQHGLIASTINQSTGIGWYAGTNTNTMAFADGIGAGKSNTDIIISNQGYGDGTAYAARLCHEYKGGGYGDWYLPSKDELNKLCLQKTVVGSFASEGYWSSTEYDTYTAWRQNFGNNNQSYYSKDNPYYVRAIRAF